MKLIYRFIMLCIVILTVNCCENDDPVDSFKEDIVEINAPSLNNSHIKVDVIQKAKVMLPPSYDKELGKNYPVVYFIHGYGDNYNHNYGIALTAFNEMVAGNINKFIFVTVNSNCVLGGTFGVNSPITGNWEDFIVKDVINYVDANYRTLPEKESRAIAGFSMGGFGALHIGLRNADTYDLVYAISPGVLNKTDFRGAYSSWKQGGGTFIDAYGATFSPNLSLKYPHAEIPLFNGTESDNHIIENWLNGFGNFDLKVSEYLEGEHRLKHIVLDYGLRDYYSWIPRGCSSLAKTFENNNIPYDEYTTIGQHEVSDEQVKTYMLPFFSNSLLFN